MTDQTLQEQDYEDDDWIECWHCGGDGVSHHDCGEDTCCCLAPEDNVRCDICFGKGGWHQDEKGDSS